MSNPFTPLPDDGAIQMLRMIFGSVMDKIVAQSTVAQVSAVESSNMLGETFRYFNSGILFFTAIIMTWVTMFGIANSANDGEVLGKKWSTFYTPLRTFGSAFALIPTASGYSAIQIFLLMVTSWSIAFGSNMWRAALTYAYTNDLGAQVAQSVMDDKSFEDLAMSAIRMQVCAYSVTKAYQTVTGDTTFSMQMPSTPTQVISKSVLGGSQTVTSDIGYSSTAWGGSANICGKIRLSDTYDTNTSQEGTTNQTVKNLHDAIVKIRYQYTLGLFDPNGGIAPIVAKIIQTAETDGATIDAVRDVATPLETIRKQMTSDITTGVTSQLASSNAGVITTLGAQGWIYAGSLYREISTIKEAVASASKSKYEYMPGTDGVATKLAGDFLTAFTGITSKYDVVVSTVAKKALAAPSTSQRPGPEKMQTTFTKADFADGGAGLIASVKQMLNALPNLIVTSSVMYLSETDGDPIWKIKDLGDNLRFIIEGTYATNRLIGSGLAGFIAGAKVAAMELGGVAAVVAAVPVGVATYIQNLLAGILSDIAIPLHTVLYLGYFLSIWVPAIPFFIYTVGVAGWAIFVIEMLAAGSLWMAAHTTPAREDSFIGSQTQGYMLIMSGFFRPAFMVMGVIASIVITKPLVQYLNASFVVMFKSMTVDSYIGVTGTAGYLLLYCTILFSMLSLIFALPQSLPDRILRWVGAGIGDMGEQSTMGKIEGSASGQARTAAQVMGAKSDAARRAVTDADNKQAQSSRDQVQKSIMESFSQMAVAPGDMEGQGGQSRNASMPGGGSPSSGGGGSSGGGMDTSSSPGGDIEGQGGASRSTGTPSSGPKPET